MSDDQFFELGDFALQGGSVLPRAKLAYRTYGRLNEAKDNVIVFPTWFTAQPADVASVFVGTGRALDPDKYFIILPAHFGAGLSSSPSNTPEPYDRGRFPLVSTYDNIVAQHQLVTKKFGIDTIRLVGSWSMGACQAYAWAALYPEMVQNLAPINGSARTAHFNKVFLEGNIRALQGDPAYNFGYYDRPLISGIKTMSAIYAGWALSEPFYRNEEYRVFGARDVEHFIEIFWEPFYLKNDANDLLAQLVTWRENDLGAHPNFGGDFERALSSITARTIIIQAELDRYFPPVDSDYEAQHIPQAEVRRLDSTWGHMMPFNPAALEIIDTTLRELL